MSKSHGEGHVIELADEPQVIEKKVKKAVTASEGGGEAPGVTNLLLLLEHFAEHSVHASFVEAEKNGDIRYGDLKQAVSDAVGAHFEPFRTRRAELMENHDEIASILSAGADAMRSIAENTMNEVRSRVGIR